MEQTKTTSKTVWMPPEGQALGAVRVPPEIRELDKAMYLRLLEIRVQELMDQWGDKTEVQELINDPLHEEIWGYPATGTKFVERAKLDGLLSRAGILEPFEEKKKVQVKPLSKKEDLRMMEEENLPTWLERLTTRPQG